MNPDRLAIIVVGASGDLAQRKLLPALFSLFAQRLLPADTRFFGFARTEMDDAAFRERTALHLTCRYTPGVQECSALTAQFLERCHYVAGDYASPEAFVDLAAAIRRHLGPGAHRLFHLAIPPEIFLATARAIGGAGLVGCEGDAGGWSRVVVEKPFGRDRASSDLLTTELGQVFSDAQTYRMDHYLGKEAIQNLLVLRFANRVFEPLWSREFIRDVRIVWKEPQGVGNRGGYFDRYGIIRDVMQNHLMQMLALVAMERPAGPGAHAVRDEKVRVLRAIPPAAPPAFALGQYAAAGAHPGYREEPGIPPGARTATYAAAVLNVNNDRWRGVPFWVEAGKAVDAHLTEIRLRFRPGADGLFGDATAGLPSNELVIRVQPGEAIHLRIVNKRPGTELRLAPTELNLSYREAFPVVIPEAYESLLLDAIEGDKSLFIRADELAAAWDIFDPALHAFDAPGHEPEPYPFGSAGPAGRLALAARHGISLED